MLKARLATGFILIAIFLAAVFLAPEKLWWALVAIVMAIAAHEWARLAGLTGAAALAYAAVTLAFAASALWYPGYSSRAVIYAAAAVFWLVVAPLWLWRCWSPTGVAIVAVAGWLVLVPTALALIDLRKGGGGFMLALMATVWIADSAAYFAGRRFGKRKLAPQISPGKTWEGVAGALLAVAIYAAGLFMLFHYQLGFVFALLLLVPLSIVGDLFESWIKRRAGAKDSGHLLPGHGGVLDRIDGLTATLPLAAGALLLLHRSLA